MQASLGRFMLRILDIGPLLFGAETTALGHWGRRDCKKVLDVIFGGGDPEAQDRWSQESVRTLSRTNYVSVAGAQMLAALACGKYSDIGIASLPHRLAALASWRPDEADDRLVCPGISIPSGSASLFTEVSRKTHLALTAAEALRDAASAGGLTGDLKKADDAKRAGALKRITDMTDDESTDEVF